MEILQVYHGNEITDFLSKEGAGSQIQTSFIKDLKDWLFSIGGRYGEITELIIETRLDMSITVYLSFLRKDENCKNITTLTRFWEISTEHWCMDRGKIFEDCDYKAFRINGKQGVKTCQR